MLLRRQRLLFPEAPLLLAGSRLFPRLLRDGRLTEDLLLLLTLLLWSGRRLLEHWGSRGRRKLLRRQRLLLPEAPLLLAGSRLFPRLLRDGRLTEELLLLLRLGSRR